MACINPEGTFELRIKKKWRENGEGPFLSYEIKKTSRSGFVEDGRVHEIMAVGETRTGDQAIFGADSINLREEGFSRITLRNIQHIISFKTAPTS
jgi:hypothetical protein